MPGHFHSGLLLPLPGPLGGEGIRVHDAGIHMHASPEVADQDRDPGYGIQDKLSYPYWWWYPHHQTGYQP